MEYADGRMLADKESGIGWMTFNNPARRNAMTMEMWQGADAILADFEADPEVRVIVLKGAGDKAFVSGADISQFEKNRADAAAAARYSAATDAGRRRLATAEKPVIAMIRGFCMGGGLGIAMTCDLRFAADGSEFGIRLYGGTELPGPDYDEWDCIFDLECYGLVKSLGTGIHPEYRMTEWGNKAAAELRKYRSQGGQLARYRYKEDGD